jgi:hypothetical protein
LPAKRGFLLACLLGAGLALAGCSYRIAMGEMPSGDPQASIRPGVTTAEEVRKAFGAPDLTGLDEDGRTTWTYTRMAVDIRAGGPSRLAEFLRLTVAFEGQVVKSLSFDRKVKEE